MLHGDDGQKAWSLSSHFMDNTLRYVSNINFVEAALQAHAFASAVHYNKGLHCSHNCVPFSDYYFIERPFHHPNHHRYGEKDCHCAQDQYHQEEHSDHYHLYQNRIDNH